ncbi:MAG: hypothetical protein MJZ98_02030 [Paludibacteraceae bacterium]|nr:hypothetical protein [Paludibacteraceae bacterium]
MKKFFGVLAFVAVCACGFTSCDDDACYIVTTKAEVMGQTVETKTYFYGEKDAVDTYVENAKKVPGVKSVTKKRVNKAQSDCIGLAD